MLVVFVGYHHHARGDVHAALGHEQLHFVQVVPDETDLGLGQVWVLRKDGRLELVAVEEAHEQELLELFPGHLVLLAPRQHQVDHHPEGQGLN